jgi:hypothetical protein
MICHMWAVFWWGDVQDPCQLLFQQDKRQHLDAENHQRGDQGCNECNETYAL